MEDGLGDRDAERGDWTQSDGGGRVDPDYGGYGVGWGSFGAGLCEAEE